MVNSVADVDPIPLTRQGELTFRPCLWLALHNGATEDRICKHQRFRDSRMYKDTQGSDSVSRTLLLSFSQCSQVQAVLSSFTPTKDRVDVKEKYWTPLYSFDYFV